MKWSSIDEIITGLGLNSDVTDLPALRKEVVKRIDKIHPDKSGKPYTGEYKEEFLSLREAQDYIDLKIQNTQALVPISEIPAIVKSFRDLGLIPIEAKAASLRAEAKSDAKARIRDGLILPRIGSGAFAVLSGSLVAFSKGFPEQSALGQFFASSTAQIGVLYLTFISILLFVMTWLAEEKGKAKIDEAMSESGRKRIFATLIDLDNDPYRVFTLGEVTQLVERYYGRRRLVGLGAQMTLPTAESIAKAHLAELEERGVIERLRTRRLELKYQVVNEA